MWAPRKLNKNLPIDFYARRTHFIDHMTPVWNAMPDRIKGKFYVPQVLLSYVKKQVTNIETLQSLNCRSDRPTSCVEIPSSRNPVVTSAYGDMQLAAHYNERPLILMEHGVGLTFNQANGKTVSGYGGGEGYRANVSLFLAPNEYIAKKTRAVYPEAPQVIIGTPKLDPWADAFNTPKKARPDEPIICIAFHWDGSAVAPEAGNAWEYYRKFLPALKDKVNLIGHAHPKIADKLEFQYQKMAIPFVKNFVDVMKMADVYLNDCSSTMYEFCVTGKPVVVLNAPWFRKWFNHGIRFWDYSDVGPICEKPEELLERIEEALEDPPYMRTRRKKYVKELYPNLGTASKIAAEALEEFCYG
jgi:hypothetical protein